MRIRSKTTVEERWRAIQKEYTEKGAYAQTELRQKFLETKCGDKANVRDFLDSRSTILSSLPIALANFASAQLAAARMYYRYGGKSKDEAMAVNPGSSKRKDGKGGARKPRGECWNPLNPRRVPRRRTQRRKKRRAAVLTWLPNAIPTLKAREHGWPWVLMTKWRCRMAGLCLTWKQCRILRLNVQMRRKLPL